MAEMVSEPKEEWLPANMRLAEFVKDLADVCQPVLHLSGLHLELKNQQEGGEEVQLRQFRDSTRIS